MCTVLFYFKNVNITDQVAICVYVCFLKKLYTMCWFVYLAEDTGLTGKVNVQILIRKKISYPIARHIFPVIGRITAP